MKTTVLICALVLAISGPAASAGGSSHNLLTLPDGAIGEDFGIAIEANHTWGVIPFNLVFTAAVSGNDAVLGMAWDFESDGVTDAYGARVYHTFDQAIDYEVTLEAQTAHHGKLTRTIRISGYYALMSVIFDDGDITVFGDAFPMMRAKGVPGTAYIVLSCVGQPGCMNWFQLHQMYSAGWGIESHTMTHRDLTQLDDSTLHWELAESQAELQAEGFPAKHFACPYTAHNDHVIDAIRLYYESNHIGDGINPRVEECDPYLLFTYTSQPYRAITVYQAHIDSVVSTGGWYILLNHQLAYDCAGASWCISTQMLSDVIDYAVANRVKIATVDEALGSVTDPLAGVAGGTASGQVGPVSIVTVANGLVSSGGDLRVDYGLSAPSHLDIAVYDVRGRRVRLVESGTLAAGEHRVWWRGDDESGGAVGSGTYFIAFRRDGDVLAVRKVPVIR
jgi:peptidoglycan/xylan/chitin deacetylase (PgdA/CDA1 family)